MLDPNTRITEGRAFFLSFNFRGEAIPVLFWELPSFTVGTPLAGDIQSALENWEPFSSGKLRLLDVLLGDGSLVVTISAQAGSDIFTFGGIGAAIRDVLNQAIPGWDWALTGLNAIGETEIPGTGSTTFPKEWDKMGGATYSPWADIDPTAPNPEPSAIPLVLLAAAAVAVLFIVRK